MDKKLSAETSVTMAAVEPCQCSPLSANGALLADKCTADRVQIYLSRDKADNNISGKCSILCLICCYY